MADFLCVFSGASFWDFFVGLLMIDKPIKFQLEKLIWLQGLNFRNLPQSAIAAILEDAEESKQQLKQAMLRLGPN